MNIFNRAYQSISNINFSPISQNIFSRLSPVQQKAVVITCIALGIITTIFIATICCPPKRRVPPFVPPVNPGFGGVKPQNPQPYNPQPYNFLPNNPLPNNPLPNNPLPNNPQPYNPQPYNPPYIPPYQPPVGGVPGQHGNPDPLVNDVAMQNLLESEQNIAKIRGELLVEWQVLELLNAQRNDFLLNDDVYDDFDQPDAKKDDKLQVKQDDSQEPPVVDVKDQTPPLVLDQQDGKDDQPQVKQDDPKDPTAVDVRDPKPPLVLDQQDGKDDQPQVKQDDPKDPPVVDVKDPKPPLVLDQKDAKDDKPVAKQDDRKYLGLSKGEAKIFELQTELENALLKYPEVLRAYLENRFNNYGRKDSQEINEHLANFIGYMESFPDQKQFIRKGLEEIDTFLTNALFTSATESCLQEEQKIDLIVFHKFFMIVDTHYPIIEKQDPDLALRLKIKLANLPLVDGHVDRKSFKNIYLNEAEQRAILIDHFQKREDEAIDHAIQQLNTKSMNEKEAKGLSRNLAKDSSRLSKQNMQKLRDALSVQMGSKAPKKWDNAENIYQGLKKHFMINSYHHPMTGLTNLHLANKAKNYFETQAEIPRWYHATKYPHLQPIITSGEIRVQHRQAFNGAWVSTQREPIMGDCVLIFKHSIAEIDPNVFIGYEKGKVLWRGLQKNIPLIKPKNESGKKDVIPNVILVGLSPAYNKVEKLKVVQLLQGIGIAKPKVVSTNVVDYIQRELLLKIGSPNLTEKWWGKADVQHLENIVAQH